MVHNDSVQTCTDIEMNRIKLENELKRMEEKYERYLKCFNENTERTKLKIDEIKQSLRQINLV